MKVSDIIDEMLNECSHIVIYSSSEDETTPFFMEDDRFNESYEYTHINWALHCDWISDEDEEWKSWQHGWGKQARIVFNDIKDILPKPYRFVAFQPFDVDDDDDDEDTNQNDLKHMIMGWISDNADKKDNEDSDENNEKNKKNKNKLEKILEIFNQCLDDFYSECYTSDFLIKDMQVIVRNDYLFVKWS